jgi:hypothetical protein
MTILQSLHISLLALPILAQASFVPPRRGSFPSPVDVIIPRAFPPLSTQKKDDNTPESKTSSTKKKKKKNSPNNESNTNQKDIFSILSNPYQAGKSLRQTLDDAITSLGPKLTSTSPTSPGTPISPQRSVYYLDDRLLESTPRILSPGAIAFAQRSNTLFDRIQKPVYIPEVLVIGATTALGRVIVQRLLLGLYLY